MAKISKQEILRLAHISRIKVHEHEVDALIKDIEPVLIYASGLQEIARSYTVSRVEHAESVMRSDVVEPCNSEALVAQAPVREESYFVVPKIIKQ